MSKWIKTDFIHRLLPTVYADDLGGEDNRILSRAEQRLLKLPEMKRIATTLDRRPKHIRTEDVIDRGVAEANDYMLRLDRNGYWSRREAMLAKKAGFAGLFVAYELARNPSSDLQRFDMANNVGKLSFLFGGKFVAHSLVANGNGVGVPRMDVSTEFFPQTPGIATKDVARALVPKDLARAFEEWTGKSLAQVEGDTVVALKYRRVSAKRHNKFAYAVSRRAQGRVEEMWLFSRNFVPLGQLRRLAP